jgi:hypothetical protein
MMTISSSVIWAKLRAINTIASSLTPVSKADKGVNTEILDQCYQWIMRLEIEVEEIMNSSLAPAHQDER